jgi:hypothetical protein
MQWRWVRWRADSEVSYLDAACSSVWGLGGWWCELHDLTKAKNITHGFYPLALGPSSPHTTIAAVLGQTGKLVTSHFSICSASQRPLWCLVPSALSMKQRASTRNGAAATRTSPPLPGSPNRRSRSQRAANKAACCPANHPPKRVIWAHLLPADPRGF